MGKGVKHVMNDKRGHFKSKIFMRLFFSYVIIIVLFFSVFAAAIIQSSREAYRLNAEQAYEQKAIALLNAMDMQLMSAQSIVSAINGSETIKSLYNRMMVEKKTVESVLLFKTQSEMKSIKASCNNLNIYNVMLNFNTDARVFAAGEVIALSQAPRALSHAPYMGAITVSSLWDVDAAGNIQIHKPYLIYGDRYTMTINGSPKGTVLVLFERSLLERMVQSLLANVGGAQIDYGGETLLQLGDMTGTVFTSRSQIFGGLVCQVAASQGAFLRPLASAEFVPLFISLVIGLAFIIATYFVSKFYYRPFGNIGRIIEASPKGGENEVDTIVNGIRALIGERNGYREKMITIAPYAKQGMLHGILSGDVMKERLQILIDQEYIDLKMPYFVIALANVSMIDALFSSIVQKTCDEMSTEDMLIGCYLKDAQNIFIIANSNHDNAFEDVFYKLHRLILDKLGTSGCELTLGVSQMESDLSLLGHAYRESEKALEQMLVGGRNAVYFIEKESASDVRAYYFPKDALRRLTRHFKESNLEDLKGFLDELYEKNIRGADLQPADIHLMVDELHLTIRNALQAVSGTSTTRLNIKKPESVATIEEIFSYYATVFETVTNQLALLVTADSGAARLKDEIVAYINGHFASADLSLVMVADRFGVSTKYVGLVCKENLGTTFLQYVREKQIHMAAELLRTTDESLEDIATKCGFLNMLTFRRNFKAVMGMNPSHYRD